MGAAFLMATSAIGPGFLTQTTVFTQELLASFGFAILISILLDIGAQLNIWRIITVSENRAQDIANKLLPGLGYFLAGLIVFGGMVFNLGNMAGSGLGFQVITGLSPKTGAIISCIIALAIFAYKEAGAAIDQFTKILGLVMIVLTVYVAIRSSPPVGEAIYRTVWPEKVNVLIIVTLVGGTVGGYISFAGAHRLLDAGIKGTVNIPLVNHSAVNGILFTSLMRFILFLAALGVLWEGAKLATENPPASVFKLAAGQIGYKFFGIVMWSAAITSVIGASYTSVSFWKTLHPLVNRYERYFISGFIIIATLLFMLIGSPVKLLILAGAINGMILPVALAVILLASSKKSIVGNYKHPVFLKIIGWGVVLIMSWMSFYIIKQSIGKL